ncbi:MAG: heme o synthase [Candidatus Omnitrophica bacterium]|nr:heme o synthase [Candidatus Omnitrophota bacterium]
MIKTLINYLKMTKLPVTGLVLMTTAAGFFLAGGSIIPSSRFIYLMLGAGLSCSGSAVLNQYLERDLDAKMSHSRNRPLPAGEIIPLRAFNFGVILVLLGVVWLYLTVNLLTAFLSLVTAFIYIIVYTPMKRASWLNTSIGAIAGALPPVGGWAAASGNISGGAWFLFSILFIWQHTHFYAICWMLRQDYRSAGMKMLSAIEPQGRRTFKHILLHSLLLVPVSVLPFWSGISGRVYYFGALSLGIALVVFSLKLFFSGSDEDTRLLFKASVAYLPALILLIVADSVF